MQKIALISVDFNGHEDTLELVKSLSILTKPQHFQVEIIIVDNGSNTPLSFDKDLNVNLYRLEKNLGFTGGYNYAISQAINNGADYLFIINNDTTCPDKEILVKLLEEIKHSPSNTVLAPKIYYHPGYEYHQDRYKTNEKGKVIWWAGGWFDWKSVMGRHLGVDEVDKGQYDQLKTIEMVSGCVFFLSTKLWGRVGGFDNDFFAYFDDVDWNFRAKKMGIQMRFCPQTFIYHKVSQTTGIGSPFTDLLLTRNRLIFGFRWGKTRIKLALLKEAIKTLIGGRKAQKKGIVSFFYYQLTHFFSVNQSIQD